MRDSTSRLHNVRLFAGAVALLSMVAVGACGGVGSSDQSGSTVWRHGMIKAKGDAEFSAKFAEDKEFFKKHNINVKISEFEGSTQLTQALASGQLDSIENNPDPVLAAIASGAKATAIGSTLSGMAYNLYARKDIKTLEQLQGKMIGVSKPGAFPDLITRAMMSEKGMNPDSIVLVNAGDDATRYRALVAGRIDAVAASVEFAPQAEKDGLHILAKVREIVPEWPRFILWANPTSLEKHPDLAVSFMEGMVEGLNYAVENKDEAVDFAAKTIHLKNNDPRLTYTYEEQAPLVARDGAVPVDKLDFVAGFLNDIGKTDTKVDVSKIIDTSFQEQAVAQLKKD